MHKSTSWSFYNVTDKWDWQTGHHIGSNQQQIQMYQLLIWVFLFAIVRKRNTLKAIYKLICYLWLYIISNVKSQKGLSAHILYTLIAPSGIQQLIYSIFLKQFGQLKKKLICFYNLNISFLLIFDIASRVKIANIWFLTSDIWYYFASKWWSTQYAIKMLW